MNALPVVSVCCVTYNHAPFIRQCLDGFLMQQNVDFEILIHDDCSTDGTTEIVREYADKYPALIHPLFEAENQYSKIGSAGIDMFNFSRVRGKYIAYCEGDDYWTDPLKLQKQVEFMDAHPEYSVCFHSFRNHDVSTNEWHTSEPELLLQRNGDSDGVDIDLNMYFNGWYTQPLSMLIRTSLFDLTWRLQYKYYRDMHEIYHLLKVGKCRLMNFDGGVRNMHSGGLSAQISAMQYCQLSLPMDGEFFRHNKQELGARRIYMDTLQRAIEVYAESGKLYAIGYAIQHLCISHHYKTFFKNLKFILFK